MHTVFLIFIIVCLISIFLFSRCPRCKSFSLFLEDAKSQRNLDGYKKYFYRYAICPKCGFELKDFYTKKIEQELKKKFDEKQKKLFGDRNEELEAEKLKNSLLEKKSKENEELLKEKIKSDLSADFSAKELGYKRVKINLEGKIFELERNKKSQIEVAVAAKLQQQKSELVAEFSLEKTEQINEIGPLKKLIEEL